ncbi:MAG: osmoprotectant NAGGN system M42 family peptidase [Sneathiella sp.]|jgi:peptidase M42 family hydrolase|uniref:osmoprotectant NAGGN system M42 family peptidase n=1 Tax=Sneathiella sp. TaxID=1964365 RepID=UPI000C657D81|nr:osmoprotectant NAGGN system M42 family peptidase [Sneathiella sp.]MAL77745.1 osmoprotectant NAGGN system M42 family peptidase [Sneathiella sp.]
MKNRQSIDHEFLITTLKELLNIPSPTGMTDEIVGYICHHLTAFGIPFELTRRGAVRADLKGVKSSPDRAIVSHLDTLGAMVKGFYENGRLQLVPIGSWSARFAEGARVTVYADEGQFRGTILPLKASGHTYNDEIDTQPINWTNLELRLDEKVSCVADTVALGINVGDAIAIDPMPEFTDNGFICSRHLDDKAGVASVLAAAKSIVDDGALLPIDCHLLFTISEEVGVGASHVLHGDVAELVSIDNGTIAPQQYTSEYGVTVAMQDSSGPFDRQLTRSLINMCEDNSITYSRDVFRYYRSDAAAAVEAGNDIRTALLCFALDSSHGYERTHLDSLTSLSRLLVQYMKSKPLFHRDEERLGSVGDLPIVSPDVASGS